MIAVATNYREAIALPLLTGDVLFQLLERSKTDGQTATLRDFRQWVKAQQS
jgi:hypothetical protein